MSIALAPKTPEPLPEAVEQVLVGGDLSKLTTQERLRFYLARCAAAGLDPRCRPFEYLSLSGKLVLYAKKECAEQLNGLHRISHKISGQSYDEKSGLIEVMVEASMGDRVTFDVGIVHAGGLKGGDLANAKMKAVTKAKRRATLSLCGLGDVIDESETDTLSDVRPCDERGQLIPPKNDSGLGRGQYASDQQTNSFLEAMDAYLERRNQAWLDRWTDENTGEVPSGVKELVRRWQADNHLVKWAIDCGKLDPASIPETGLKNAQIGRYTAIVYHRGNGDRKALTQELRRYIDQQEERATEALRTAHAELFEPQADDVDAEMAADWEPGTEG